jgi:hypothetical protein
MSLLKPYVSDCRGKRIFGRGCPQMGGDTLGLVAANPDRNA